MLTLTIMVNLPDSKGDRIYLEEGIRIESFNEMERVQ